ncbi:MAG TPA: MATE family efflux transporter [Spirochaetota bacterium]|nr:MATE family efflux transporter [Spirochaetota bacterium]HPC40789.1 MATE family efflux transporter [Spirochaetota bacterium]HPL15762.1 MATE family efflux transporter [Spirochaetota bacterium]HQF07821.1 MATE family efflux transporter [Spirochaetota bacterium]HQH96874.1 MATE family efflux transporter [Spirochaetota bacterium]
MQHISETSGGLKGYFFRRYKSEGGYRDILSIAIPLIFTTGSWALQNFIDRMFLNWYDTEVMAASMPAGILNFTFVSLFMGTVGYVSTFVAQYYGSDQNKMMGKVLWQALYISIVSGVIIMFIIPFSDSIFAVVGHDGKVREYEAVYFRILCYGAVPLVASSAMSGFFSGIGKTWIIMIANFAATAENIIVDYLLIFGNFGFPRMGIEGAAIATVLSACVSFAIYAAVLFRASYNDTFNTVRGWRPDMALMKRLIRFGLPNGVQFFLDMMGITVFVLIIGRLGTDSLASTNIAFNVNTIAFMPMIGLGITVSVLVGQYLGMNNPDMAEYSVYSGLHLAVAYMGAVALLYIWVPDLFMCLYAAGTDAEKFRPTAELAKVLLRFVALYSVFDAMNIIFASAIKGAGDTHFVMKAIIILSIFGLIVPTGAALFLLDLGIYAGWTVLTGYVMLLGIVFMLRFKGGRWKSMRVIEETPITIPPSRPEGLAGKVEV